MNRLSTIYTFVYTLYYIVYKIVADIKHSSGFYVVGISMLKMLNRGAVLWLCTVEVVDDIMFG